MRCTACGKDNAPERRFCAECGAALPRPCPSCAFANDAAARFCGGCGLALQALAEAPARSWPGAERRQLTLLFCDLCQSTMLSDRLDPEDMRDVLDAYRNRCSAALARYDGTVAYFMGDGILAYFGYPTANEDDAIRAVRAALEIVPAVGSLGQGWPEPLPLPLRVRIAIHTGLVVAGEIGVDKRRSELWAVGKAPNVAARLQILAEPDSIVVSDATHRLLRGVFQSTSMGRHELAGIGETVEVFRIESERRLTAVSEHLDSASDLGSLVNREAELAFLEDRWRAVLQGDGQAVLLSGEPGIGKSRLLRAMISRLQASEHQVLLLRGSPYFAESPLHPVIEHLQLSAGITREQTPERRLEQLERHAGSLRERVPHLVEVLAYLLDVPQTRYTALASLAPQERRARTLDALCGFVLGLAAARPLAMVFEDLQWADPTTRDWLGRLMDRLDEAPLLALLTLRSDTETDWVAGGAVHHVRLERLSREESAEIVDQVVSGSGLDEQLRERILVATDGVPLFVEELTKALLEAQEPAPASATGSAQQVVIPTTIQDSLTARLDRLGDAKQIAQVAATIGREFSRDLLSAVAGVPESDLAAALARLQSSGLVHPIGPAGESFAFKHALVRDAAYDGLLRATRRQLHARIVEALETSFPAVIEANPELAAQHCTEAQAYEGAVRYWMAAGRQAIARSAHVEAVSHLERGLLNLRRLAPEAATDRRRLEYLVTLGPSLMMTQGLGAQRVEAVYAEAVNLCEQVEPSLDHVAAFWGWWRITTGRDRAERLLTLAERLADPAVLLQAHHCLWATRFGLGDFEGSWRHIEAGLKLYEQGDYRTQADYFGGHDAKVCGCGEAALVHWHLGSPERALRHCLDALAWSEQLDHTGSRLHALDIAITLRRYRREPDAARKLAQRMTELGRERGFVDHLARGRLYLGWTVAAAGGHEQGIAMIEEAFAVERASGAPEDFPIYADILAEALVAAGRTGAALDEVERAIAESEERAMPIWLPELHRRRGEVLLALSAPRPDEAEACFGEALALARNQRSRALALRAATSLARLWRGLGMAPRARGLLGDIYEGFGEGFDTPDLREARQELDALGWTRRQAQPVPNHARR